MIELEVVGLRGTRVDRALKARFGPSGGTIGRAPTNTLVLDDPDRTVSRVHAQVEVRGGRFFVVDRGSNPMQLNGQPLGAEREAMLSPGDKLNVGSFELVCRAASEQGAGASTHPAPLAAMPAPASLPSDDDPFADLLAGLGAPAASAASPSPSSPRGRATPSDADALFPDPMAMGAKPRSDNLAGVASSDDPFADLFGAGSGASPEVGSHVAAPAMGIDDLFRGLGNAPAAGTSPFDDPFLAPPSPDKGAARSDHLPIDRFGFTPPNALVPAPPPAPPPSAAVVSSGSLLDDLADIASPPPKFCDETGAPLSPAAPKAAPAASFVSSNADPALLAAFLRGLGSDHQVPDTLTPELMERIGALLRTSTEGTLQLLQARQQLKREVRAEVTMIAAQANNPLKFSPTVEVALAHMLGPGVRGFMGPTAAMRDAYDDLRAHEFGVMVGMRAALAHVLARFTPEELEKKITAKSALDSLFAANRKAKLWDQFVALYGNIASEAEEDFLTLFGQAFNEAYAEQMARLKFKG